MVWHCHITLTTWLTKQQIQYIFMWLTYCEQMYAIFCSVFMAFNTSSESNLCIGRMKDGRHNHQNKWHAQRPFSSLLSANQYTDLAILFFSNHQPSMECGQANILEQVTDPDMTGNCRHIYGGNQAEYAIIVENNRSDHSP